MWHSEMMDFLFSGEGDTPEESENTQIDTQMISLFYNEEYFGIVTEGEEESYLMTLYGPEGRQRCSREFDMEYQNISVSGERIILWDSFQVEIYDLGGKLKFQGDVREGNCKKSVPDVQKPVSADLG